MKKIILILIPLLSIISSFAQTVTFTPGWYIVEKGASYASYDPLQLVGGIESATTDGDSIADILFGLKAGEAVFASELSSDIYYCFDPSGTPILIKGKHSLTKAPSGFGVGIIISEIQLLSGASVSEGMYVWIVGQDVAKQTIKIQLNNNSTLEIPESKISLLTAMIKKNTKETWFKNAE